MSEIAFDEAAQRWALNMCATTFPSAARWQTIPLSTKASFGVPMARGTSGHLDGTSVVIWTV